MVPNFLTYLQLCLLLCSLIGVGYLFYALEVLQRFFQRPALSPENTLPPVTILKPLHGADFALAENLRSFLRQDYPNKIQIIFGMRDADDKARAIVDEIIADFPQAEIDVVIGVGPAFANPKVANLQNMLCKASYPALVMVDSDMRVSPNYLRQIVTPLQDGRVGCVTCLYRGVSAGGHWSDLACLQVNYGFMWQALIGDAVGLGAGCFGATIALKRETLEQMGGFAAIAHDLADDHALGMAMTKLGKRVELSHFVVDNIIDEPNFSALFHHELRWARTIRFLEPVGYASSFITHPVALATLALVSGGFSWLGAGGFVLVLLCRFFAVKRASYLLKLPAPAIWQILLRDLLSFTVFITSFASRTVKWRQSNFLIDQDRLIVNSGD